MLDRPADRLEALIAASGITTTDAVICPLTCLIAGPAARRLLEHRLGQPPGRGRSWAVTLIDVNGLKAANDSGGHEAGDRLLEGVGRLLRCNVRDGDAFRVGGDEFVVVHLVRAAHASADAAAIQRRLRGLLGSRAAVGTAPWDGCIEDTLRLADQLMYVHKASQQPPLVS